MLITFDIEDGSTELILFKYGFAAVVLYTILICLQMRPHLTYLLGTGVVSKARPIELIKRERWVADSGGPLVGEVGAASLYYGKPGRGP